MGGGEDNKLRSAVRSALELATQYKLKKISLPAISTGIFGFPKERGVRVIFETVRDFLEHEETSLEEVRFCNIDRETSKLFEKLLEEYENR